MADANTTTNTTTNVKANDKTIVLSYRACVYDGNGGSVMLGNDGTLIPAKNPVAHKVHFDDVTKISEFMTTYLTANPGKSVEVWIERDHGLTYDELTNKPVKGKKKE